MRQRIPYLKRRPDRFLVLPVHLHPENREPLDRAEQRPWTLQTAVQALALYASESTAFTVSRECELPIGGFGPRKRWSA